jgi:hypothetical protein
MNSPNTPPRATLKDLLGAAQKIAPPIFPFFAFTHASRRQQQQNAFRLKLSYIRVRG